VRGGNKQARMMAKCFDWVMEKLRIYFFPSPSHKHKRAIVVSSSEPRDTTYDPIVENVEGYDSQLFPEKARLIEKNILRINYFWHGTYEKIILQINYFWHGTNEMLTIPLMTMLFNIKINPFYLKK